MHVACRCCAARGNLNQASPRKQEVAWMSARARVFNLAQWFLTESCYFWTSLREKKKLGRTTAKPVQHCLCTVWRYLIWIVTELLQRKGLLTEGWEQRKTSAAHKTFIHLVSHEQDDRYLLGGYPRALSAEAMRASNQPIHQPLALEAFLSARRPSAFHLRNVFLKGKRGRNVMVSLSLREGNNTKGDVAESFALVRGRKIQHKAASCLSLYVCMLSSNHHPFWGNCNNFF